jgi:hypothetical protein
LYFRERHVKYRWPVLRSVFPGYVKDPARKVTVPSQLRDTDKTTLTWEQLRNALSHLSLRDRILLELDMTNAPAGVFFAIDPASFTIN